MESRKIIRHIIGCGLLCLFMLTSCIKDDLYNTPHPKQGTVIVATVWTEYSDEAVLPDNYILRIGQEFQTVTGKTNTFNYLFNPGKYNLLAYNIPKGITILGNSAIINTLPNGTLEPEPGYLFSGIKDIDITADDTLRTDIKMTQRTYKTTLTLHLNEDDDLLIASTQATLTGIVAEIDIVTGKPVRQKGKSILPEFKLEKKETTRAEIRFSLTTTFFIIGIVPEEKQQFTLVINLTNGKTQTVVSDLSKALKESCSEPTPAELSAHLDIDEKGDPEVGFIANVGEWIVTDGGNVTIK